MAWREYGFQLFVERKFQVVHVFTELEFLVLQVGKVLVGEFLNDFLVFARCFQLDATLFQILLVGFVVFDLVAQELSVGGPE